MPARFRRSALATRNGEISLEAAADLGCRACATPGGGCQFLGTAATSQVIAEALGLTVPHAALAPSGQRIWKEMARQSARAMINMEQKSLRHEQIFDGCRDSQCDGRPCGFRRIDESASASAGHRASGGAQSAERCGLERGESASAASCQRAAERSDTTSDHPRISRRRRAGSDAAFAFA